MYYMSDEKRTKIINAVNKYAKRYAKDTQKMQGNGKKNAKPEKDVEKACLVWMRARDWEVEIYESKATFSNGHWHNQAMRAGNADCQGIMPDGTSVAVEFKAPGRLSNFLIDKRILQRDFILRRIRLNGFACVVDSVERLEIIFKQWLLFREKSKELAQRYLLDMLPRKK